MYCNVISFSNVQNVVVHIKLLLLNMQQLGSLFTLQPAAVSCCFRKTERVLIGY